MSTTEKAKGTTEAPRALSAETRLKGINGWKEGGKAAPDICCALRVR